MTGSDRMDAATESTESPGYRIEVFLISFAALLLEISYTRIVSFKLYYYYTYFVIGLALLGLGSGAVLVAVWRRLRRARTAVILEWGLVLAALSVLIGYLVVARLPIRSMAIWRYGTGESFGNFVRLVVLCVALYSSFAAIGVMLATLFGRRADQIGRLYFADLLGAGLACAVAVPMMSSGGPPAITFLAGAILGLTGLRITLRNRSTRTVAALALTLVLGAGAIFTGWIPDVRVDDDKADLDGVEATRWNPVFRVDASPFFGSRQLLTHDGLPGSVILEWDGDPATLRDFKFDEDPRSLPFDTIGDAPNRVLIIGAAGGHEVLASLAFGAHHIDAVELNGAIHDLVTNDYAEFSGRFFDQPGVSYVTGDGRAFLARSGDPYDLIWYPAPDSYAVTNVAASGAFVLSESYLYTSEAITETLDHLSPNGILAAQFGELNFDLRPNRTTRYVSTVRHALAQLGIDDPGSHVLVASTADANFPTLTYTTVLVKEAAFTPAEILRFAASKTTIPGTRIEHLPGQNNDNPVSTVLALSDEELDDWYAQYPYDVGPIEDDAPFFWHFARFTDVVRNFGDSIHPSFVDPEDGVGERVLVLLFIVSVLFATAFLLLPFVAVRDVWLTLPRKGTSAIYFGALGLGFMLFEIGSIQRFVLFLGYPTYSLTVTLASLLIFTAAGALWSQRFRSRIRSALLPLTAAVVAVAAAYALGLPRITAATLQWPLGLRVVLAFAVLAPLGLCLGMFMPLGISAISSLSVHAREYVAWAWAVNGFASVVGAVLTTIFAMTFGFDVVVGLALVAYLASLVALRSLVAGPAKVALQDPNATDRISVPT